MPSDRGVNLLQILLLGNNKDIENLLKTPTPEADLKI